MLQRKPLKPGRGFKREPYTAPPRAPVVPIQAAEQRGVIVRIGDSVVAVPKGVQAKPGKRAPTVQEAKWMGLIVGYGCIACRLDGQQPRETAVHHILRGGVRMGHLFTLPLCDPGHHQGGTKFGLVSRHPFKARFEMKYGAELVLLAKLKQELGVFDRAEYAA